jgi:ribosomal protein S18 acetylase RimI-like enzyme
MMSGLMSDQMQEVRLRPADEEDVDFLFGLSPRLAGVPGPSWHTSEAMTDFQERFMATTLGAPQPRSMTVVAEEAEGGRRLGYIHAHPSLDAVSDEPCGHVAIIALEADAEGRGIAGRLMAEAEIWAVAQGWRLLSLDVFSENRRAIDFYIRAGFRPESTRLVKLL